MRLAPDLAPAAIAAERVLGGNRAPRRRDGGPGAASGRLTSHELAPLSQDEARNIVRQVCTRYHRVLHDAVLNALLEHTLPSGQMAAGNPLWLQLTTEELLLLDQDDFDRLGTFTGSPEEKLHTLLLSIAGGFPSQVPDLYGTLLQRTEDAYGQAGAHIWRRCG